MSSTPNPTSVASSSSTPNPSSTHKIPNAEEVARAVALLTANGANPSQLASALAAQTQQNASLPQYSVPGPVVAGSSKYMQLLALVEELGKDIRPSYTGNRNCSERLKRSLMHARILIKECQQELERNMRNNQNQQ